MTDKEYTALVLNEYNLPNIIREAIATIHRHACGFDSVAIVLTEIAELEIKKLTGDTDATS